MSALLNPAGGEVQKLRRALGDMAALSSLPALWLNADAWGIAESLAEALVRVLDLEGVVVEISGLGAVERRAASSESAPLQEALQRSFPHDGHGAGLARDLDGGRRGISIGLGVGSGSRLIAAARRPGFPSAAERLAIVSTANHAAIALRRVEVEAELRAQSELLNRERDAVAALNRTLLGERDKLRMLFEQAPGFMAILRGRDHVFEMCNASYYRLVGPRDIVGRSVRDVFPDLQGQGFFERLDTVYATGEPYLASAASMDLQLDADHPVDRRYLDFIYQPVFGADGGVNGIFVEGHDVTEQIHAAQHRELLVNELNHRVKNTLATVQSLAHQTLRGASSLPEAKVTLTSRLISLSRTHDVLTRENWASAEVAEIVTEAMLPHQEPGRNRIVANGPTVRLSARSALAISMALHELATNAAKYGALSNDSGHVTLNWEMAGQTHVHFEWQERGGPALKGAPSRHGFGSRLLVSGLATELGAPAEIDHAPSGLVCRIRAPVAEAENRMLWSEPAAAEALPVSRARKTATAQVAN